MTSISSEVFGNSVAFCISDISNEILREDGSDSLIYCLNVGVSLKVFLLIIGHIASFHVKSYRPR